RLRVYLEDTDAGGIVYHASYLRFMERARTETLRAAGLEQSQTFEQDLSCVVHRRAIDFLRAAQLDAELEVTCELQQRQGASAVFQQEVRAATLGGVHCRAVVSVACIALSSKRPRRVPPEIVAALEQP